MTFWDISLSGTVRGRKVHILRLFVLRDAKLDKA